MKCRRERGEEVKYSCFVSWNEKRRGGQRGGDLCGSASVGPNLFNHPTPRCSPEQAVPEQCTSLAYLVKLPAPLQVYSFPAEAYENLAGRKRALFADGSWHRLPAFNFHQRM